MAGIGNLVHFVGYVVDREDGQNLGRVKVKALGFHDPDIAVVNPNDLPWAYVVDGTYGAVTTIPLVGEWVFGAFLDGRDAQHPIVLGRIPGYNSQLPSGSDVQGTAQGEFASAEMFGSFPLHPAVIGEGIDELGGVVSGATPTRTEDQLKDPVGVGIDHTYFVDGKKDPLGRQHKEQVTKVPARDLNSRVISSTDDQNYMLIESEDAGVIQIVHHTGTTIQIEEDGDILIKSRGGQQTMVDGGQVNQIEGDQNTMIGQDYTLRVDNNGKMHFNNDLDIECENFSLTVRGDSVFNTKGTSTYKTWGNMFLNTGDNLDIVCESKLKIQSIDMTTLESSNNGIYLYATGGNNNIDLTSGSIKMTTEVKPNQGIDGIADANTHHLGSIDIQSADNIRIETKGTPADTHPGAGKRENSEGFIDVLSNGGIRFTTPETVHFTSGKDFFLESSTNMGIFVGDSESEETNLDIFCINDINMAASHNMTLRTTEDMWIQSDRKLGMSSQSDMDIASNAQQRIASSANTRIHAPTVFIDDFVKLAEGGATPHGTVNTNATQSPTVDTTLDFSIDSNVAPSAIPAIISSLTRNGDPVITFNTDTDEDTNPGDPALEKAAAPAIKIPPNSLGVGGYKALDYPNIPNPTSAFYDYQVKGNQS